MISLNRRLKEPITKVRQTTITNKNNACLEEETYGTIAVQSGIKK